MELTAKKGIDVHGYTFFHMQDTESVVEGAGLHLAYGAVEEGVEPMLAVANYIVAILQRHGLSTEWNGTVKKRIFVRMDWKRRR